MSDWVATSVLGRLAKAAAIIGLVGFAALALLSGSDQQSREFPNAPSLVGWPYDTGASRAKVILAFVQTGPASAIGLARRAILSDPISAQTVSILGRSQLYAQQPAEARKAFQVAGQLGWRDPMTQIYWLDQSMQAGDFKVATERLDALLRQSPYDENRDKFLAVVAETAEGRAALSKRLKLSPIWAGPYVRDVDHLSPEEITQRVAVLRLTGRGVWDCHATEAITQKLIEAKQLDEAQALWRLNCVSSSSLVYDGQFDQIDTTRTASAFDWQLSSRGDVEIALIQGGDGNRLLRVDVSAPATMPILRQMIVMKPGAYRLTWRTPDTPEIQARALQVSLACNADLSRAQPGLPDPAKSQYHRLDLTIGADCSTRQLTFWLAPGSQVRLDDVRLDAM